MSESGYGVKLVRGPFVDPGRHPNAVDDPAELTSLVRDRTGPLAADLFCGAGGLSLGLQAAGYDVIVGIDNDADALRTHRALHGGWSANVDLSDPAEVERVGELLRSLDIDLVAGGPPCQPFSRAGRSGMRDLVRRGARSAEDIRRGLWQSFLRIVVVSQPSAVLMENVPDMALDPGMWILRTMVDELEALGYSVQERVVTTSDLGVPQFRQRFFLVALADRVQFRWPQGDGAVTSVRNAIGDLPPVEGGWRPTNGDDPSDPVASGWSDYAGPRSSFQRRMRAHVPAERSDRVYDHITRPVREDDIAAFELMDSSTRYSDLPEELQRYRSDIFDDKYKRLDWDGLSRTIVAHIAKDGYWYIHPDQSRTISLREAARLQTFPDHVRFAGPPSAAFRQIGNAVPPMAAEALGAAILDSLERSVCDGFSTAATSADLANWFNTREHLAMPWLRAPTRWAFIAGEVLLSRLPAREAQLGWRSIQSFGSPMDFVENEDLVRFGVGPLGRANRVAGLVNAATKFVEAGADPQQVDSDWFDANLDIGPAAIALSFRVWPERGGLAEEPVIATTGAVRVASRFFGEHVSENRNRHTDGRLAVARLIGGEDHSHAAHLALLELGASHCAAGTPSCGGCPLADSCAYAISRGFQLELPTSP